MRLTVMGTNPQTEARAIARFDVKGWNNEQIEIPSDDGKWVYYEDHATALAAKDAELIAALHMLDLSKATTEAVLERAERAEAQLAEANKALDAVLAMVGNIEHKGGGANAARMYADMLNDIRRIARRTLTGGQEDG